MEDQIADRHLEPCRTSQCGRLLLMVTIILIPLQDHFPGMGGFGFMFIMFALLGIYALLHDPHSLDGVWLHPVFIAAYTFAGLSAILEFASPLSIYDDIIRFGLMVGGGVCIAALCRDRLALQACLYGYIGAALWLSVVLFSTSYGALQGVTAIDYTEASMIRAGVMSDVPVQANPNGMAFNCLQGGVAAFAFALTSSRLARRNLFLAIASFCLVASSLAMSRSGIAMSLVSCAIVFYSYGWRRGQPWLLAGALGLCVVLLVPNAVWTRMEFSVQGDVDQLESRAALYVLALQHLPEYFVTGTGSGNSRSALGEWSTFVHNSFLQVTVNWGLMGLTAFMVMIWQAYKCLPAACGRDPLALALLGVVISIFLMLFFIHNFNEKFFALGLGMLVASRCWIWPGGTTGEDRSYVVPPTVSVSFER